MNKKIIFILITLLMLATSVFAATANVQLNGSIIDFTDNEGNKVEAQIINNRTLVPLRKIFEELGCNVEWEATTRTATATKGDVKLILQIDNKNVKKVVGGKESTIVLDVAPTIYNNRTLVPLRFIAESLDKQVGWDASNYTAIIIDYDYFAKSLDAKASLIYKILENNYDNFEFEVTKKYFDEIDANNNSTTSVKLTSNKLNDTYQTQINFYGDSELVKEIASEGWNNLDLNLQYDEENIRYSTTNTTFAKMLTTAPNQENNVSYTTLRLDGNVNDDFAEYIRNIIDLKDNELNINSFEKVNNEWKKVLNKISYKNINGNVTFNINNLYDIDFEYFDFAKLDNIIYGNSINRIYNFVNKKIFNYDLNLDELLYDMTSISVNGTVSSDGKNANVEFTGTTDYDEKIVYSINLNIK